ncbi:MAG: molybdenum cofactor synthesis domain-containing protein [Polyangiales bacterium]|jgi:molybdenum cofactor synthesis domain-containing protein
MLVIGNEVLTGKVEEANIAVAAKMFFELGISLRRIVVCIDDVSVIAEDVRNLAAAHDFVITSGGIGPTHDDVTYEGIAAAFGRRVVRSDELEGMLREHHEAKERDYPISDAQLRMADIIEGCRMLRRPNARWPTLVVENVYVLPGVPEIFRMKIPLIREELDEGQQLHSFSVFTRQREGEIAALLEDLESRFEGVQVGSYLAWDSALYSVKVTFDSLNEDQAKAVSDEFVAAIGDSFVSREEPTTANCSS